MHFLQLLENPDLRSLYKTLNNKKTLNDKVKAEPFFLVLVEIFSNLKTKKGSGRYFFCFLGFQMFRKHSQEWNFRNVKHFLGGILLCWSKNPEIVLYIYILLDSEIIMLFFWGGRVLLKVLIKRTNAILFSYL